MRTFPPIFSRFAALAAILLATPISSPRTEAQTSFGKGSETGATERPSVMVQFPNAPVDAILPFYQKLTGKRLIKDANLTGGMLSIYSAAPLTRRDAISYIETSLLMNGYAVIPAGPETVKIVNSGGGQHPRAEGLPVIVSPELLPEHDKVVNYIMHLDHISPEEAQRTFSQIVQLHPYGTITPLTNAAGIIITENSATIRSLVELKDHIDVPPAQITNTMIPLRRADAEKIAEIVNLIFEHDGGTTRSPAAYPAAPDGDPSPDPIAPHPSPTAASTNPTAAKVRVIPDKRTNRLLVIARPVDLAYIESIVADLDQPSDDINFLNRKLNYIPVQEFLPVAKNALARDTDIESDPDLDSPRNPSPSSGLTASNGQSSSNASADRDGSGGIGNLLGEAQRAAAPQSAVVGGTLLIADSQANTLIVSGSPEHIQIIEKLIAEMDQRPRQIYISTVIGQLTLGDEHEVGLDLVAALDGYNVLGNEVSAGAGLITGAGVPDFDTLDVASGYSSLSGLSVYGQVANISAVLRLSASDQNFKILSRPSVYTTNRSKAVISSGQRIPVPVSTLSSLTNADGAVTSNIEFRDVVLKLEVIPLINSDDEVTLQIAQVNDNIIGNQTVANSEIPIISTQELNTTVTVKNGQTIVLGGLITERETLTNRGIPVLRKIPIIRALTSTTKSEITREELIIFIQPHIINPDDSLDTPTDIELDRSEFAAEALQYAEPTALKAVPVQPLRSTIIPKPLRLPTH